LKGLVFFGMDHCYVTKSLDKKAESPIQFGNPAV
jgi:hypothetical protein